MLVGHVSVVWRIQRRSTAGMRDSGSRFTTILPPDPARHDGQAAVGDGELQPPSPAITLDDVAGVDEAKLELTETIEFLRSPSASASSAPGSPRDHAVGPPGTGKTMLAAAVAAEAGVPSTTRPGSSSSRSSSASGAKRIRDLFAQARKLGRGVIFFDEFDAIGKARGGPNSHEEREQTLNQLLVELDGFGTTDDVDRHRRDEPASTSSDPRVLRPGRFNRKIHVGPAGREGSLGDPRGPRPEQAARETIDLEESPARRTASPGRCSADLLNEAAILAAARASRRSGRGPPRRLAEGRGRDVAAAVDGRARAVDHRRPRGRPRDLRQGPRRQAQGRGDLAVRPRRGASASRSAARRTTTSRPSPTCGRGWSP
jgi:cell division protease FtsH